MPLTAQYLYAAALQANVEKGMQLEEQAALIGELQAQLASRPGQEALGQLSAAQVGAVVPIHLRTSRQDVQHI